MSLVFFLYQHFAELLTICICNAMLTWMGWIFMWKIFFSLYRWFFDDRLATWAWKEPVFVLYLYMIVTGFFCRCQAWDIKCEKKIMRQIVQILKSMPPLRINRICFKYFMRGIFTMFPQSSVVFHQGPLKHFKISDASTNATYSTFLMMIKIDENLRSRAELLKDLVHLLMV